MKVHRPQELPDLTVVEPVVHQDDRGFFLETWRRDRYGSMGISAEFVQTNHSRSERGILRGLHFQHPRSQGKLVRVSRGEIFDVAVDVRLGSPTFGKGWGVRLSDTNHRQLWIPPGFAHGLFVLSDVADVEYKCTEYYYPEYERTLRWNDPRLALDWPDESPRLSPKDAQGLTLGELHDLGALPRIEH